MKKQHAEIGLRGSRREKEAAIHIRMPSWLPHQRPPKVIVLLLSSPTLLQNGLPRRHGKPAGDNPERLAGHMDINCGDAVHQRPPQSQTKLE
jgi:hypothetical protein